MLLLPPEITWPQEIFIPLPAGQEVFLGFSTEFSAPKQTLGLSLHY